MAISITQDLKASKVNELKTYFVKKHKGKLYEMRYCLKPASIQGNSFKFSFSEYIELQQLIFYNNLCYLN